MTLKAMKILVVIVTILLLANGVQGRNKARGLSPAWGRRQGLHSMNSPSHTTVEPLKPAPLQQVSVNPHSPQLEHQGDTDTAAATTVPTEEYRSAIIKTSLSVSAAGKQI